MSVSGNKKNGTILDIINQTESVQNTPAQKKADPVEKIIDMSIDMSKAPNQPRPKSPGRPKKSQSPKKNDPVSDKTAKAISDNLVGRKLRKKIKALRIFFPEELKELYNIKLEQMSPEDLKLIYESARFAIEDDLEIHMIPGMVTSFMKQTENAAVATGFLSKDPKLQNLRYLAGFTDRAIADPSFNRELKLMTIDLLDMVPTNPYFRWLSTFVNLALSCYQENIAREQEMINRQFQPTQEDNTELNAYFQDSNIPK